MVFEHRQLARRGYGFENPRKDLVAAQAEEEKNPEIFAENLQESFGRSGSRWASSRDFMGLEVRDP